MSHKITVTFKSPDARDDALSEELHKFKQGLKDQLEAGEIDAYELKDLVEARREELYEALSRWIDGDYLRVEFDLENHTAQVLVR